MPTTNFSYTNTANYTFDKTELASGKAKQSLQTQTGITRTSNFGTPAEYTYDAAKVDLTGGIAALKNLTPANSHLGATWTSSANANWHSGSGTPPGYNLIGSPTVSGGLLNCLGGGNVGLYYDSSALANVTTQGAFKTKFKPNYSGTPPANQSIFELKDPAGVNNRICLFHGATGYFRLTTHDNTGAAVHAAANVGGSVWSPVSGTTYELEFNFNAATGVFSVYINGTLHGSASVLTYTRGSSATRFYLGAGALYAAANHSYDDLVVFSTAQHTSNYTPGYTLPETKFDLTNPTVVLETQKLSFLAPFSLLSVTGFAATEPIALPEIVKYEVSTDDGTTWLRWNGSAWVTSSGYSTANTKSELNTNLPSLDVATSDKFKVRAYLHSDLGHTTPTLDDVIVTYSASQYSSEATVLTNTPIETNGITSMAETATRPGTTNIRYIAMVNGTLKYWNGSAWATSNGTYAQATEFAAFNTNIGTLVASPSLVKFMAVFYTPDNISTAELDDLSVTYNYELSETTVTTCAVAGYIKDKTGTAVSGATVEFTPTSKEWAEDSNNLVTNALQNAVTNGSGYFEINLLPGTYYVKHYKSGVYLVNKKNGDKIQITVPSGTAGINITDLI